MLCINDVSDCFFCRPNWEGGQYDGDDATRFEALRLAMELGVDYVDIELKVCFHKCVKLLRCSQLVCSNSVSILSVSN